MGQVNLLTGNNRKKSNHMGNGFIGDFRKRRIYENRTHSSVINQIRRSKDVPFLIFPWSSKYLDDVCIKESLNGLIINCTNTLAHSVCTHQLKQTWARYYCGWENSVYFKVSSTFFLFIIKILSPVVHLSSVSMNSSCTKQSTGNWYG